MSDVDSCDLGSVGGREMSGGVLEVMQRAIIFQHEAPKHWENEAENH